jgi:hypothetical protein
MAFGAVSQLNRAARDTEIREVVVEVVAANVVRLGAVQLPDDSTLRDRCPFIEIDFRTTRNANEHPITLRPAELVLRVADAPGHRPSEHTELRQSSRIRVALVLHVSRS